MQAYEPKSFFWSHDKNTDVGLDTVDEEEGLPTAFSPHLTQRSQPRDRGPAMEENMRQAQVQPRDEKGQFSSPAILKLQKQLEEREMRKKEIAEERSLRNELRDALQQTLSLIHI